MIIKMDPVDRVFDVKGAGAEAAKFGKVCAAAKHSAEVMGDRADIGAFGAGDVEREAGVSVVEEGSLDGDRDRFSFDFDAFAGEFIEFFAVDFFGRVHRRSLEDGALEREEGFFDVSKSRD
jgi:hypothetical protein